MSSEIIIVNTCVHSVINFIRSYKKSMDTTNVGYSYYLPPGGWNYKIRNTLSQFSDLFSEFNKYIAPAYHHDRCER